MNEDKYILAFKYTGRIERRLTDIQKLLDTTAMKWNEELPLVPFPFVEEMQKLEEKCTTLFSNDMYLKIKDITDYTNMIYQDFSKFYSKKLSELMLREGIFYGVVSEEYLNAVSDYFKDCYNELSYYKRRLDRLIHQIEPKPIGNQEKSLQQVQVFTNLKDDGEWQMKLYTALITSKCIHDDTDLEEFEDLFKSKIESGKLPKINWIFTPNNRQVDFSAILYLFKHLMNKGFIENESNQILVNISITCFSKKGKPGPDSIHPSVLTRLKSPKKYPNDKKSFKNILKRIDDIMEL